MRKQADRAPAGPVAPRPRHRGGPSGRLAAVIGASVVLAAGLIAAALVVAGAKDATPSRTVVNRPVETVAAGSATAGASSTEALTPSEGAGSAPAESAGSADAVTTFSQRLYSIDIPAGWPQEANDEPISVYYESTWHDPADQNTTILVDAQAPAPEVPPIVSAEEVRAQTSQSADYREISLGPTTLAGLPAARWVFDVHGDRRVDYFLNLCGAGIAVLGSTYPSAFGALAPTFHQAASSIRVACE